MNNVDLSKDEIPQELLDELDTFLGDFDLKLWCEYNEDECPSVNEHCKSFKSTTAIQKDENVYGKWIHPETFEVFLTKGTYLESYTVRIEFSQGNSNVEKDTVRRIGKVITFEPNEDSELHPLTPASE